MKDQEQSCGDNNAFYRHSDDMNYSGHSAKYIMVYIKYMVTVFKYMN